MGLGPPTCDECRVWLWLDSKTTGGRGWYCPVCEKDSEDGHKHLRGKYQINNDDMIPLLRFMKGKKPNVVD